MFGTRTAGVSALPEISRVVAGLCSTDAEIQQVVEDASFLQRLTLIVTVYGESSRNLVHRASSTRTSSLVVDDGQQSTVCLVAPDRRIRDQAWSILNIQAVRVSSGPISSQIHDQKFSQNIGRRHGNQCGPFRRSQTDLLLTAESTSSECKRALSLFHFRNVSALDSGRSSCQSA
jgi:hypothetical protein